MAKILLGTSSATVLLCAAMSQAAPVSPVATSTFNVTGASLFGGASSASFDFSTSLASVLNFSVDVNSGTVNSTNETKQTFSFDDEAKLSEAGSVKISQRVSSLESGFSTKYGASANANVSLLGITVDIIDEGATVETARSKSATSFGAS